MAEEKGTLVTFEKDVYPYCRGDVVRLSSAQLAQVDESAKRKGIEGKAYKSGNADLDLVTDAEAVVTTPEIAKRVSNPELPDYPQVDETGEPVLEQTTRAQADARVREQKDPAPQEAVKRVEDAKAKVSGSDAPDQPNKDLVVDEDNLNATDKAEGAGPADAVAKGKK